MQQDAEAGLLTWYDLHAILCRALKNGMKKCRYIFKFVWDLINDALGISEYIASNVKMIYD